MKAFIAFTKKEFLEITRTYKLLVLVAVFLMLGMMGPLAAKFTPEIMKAAMPVGMNIVTATPVITDSWAQFFKNISQIGLLIIVIIFSGTMSNELSRGTLINMLTKGLSRVNVLLAKLTMMVCVWTLLLMCSFCVSYAYTAYYWPGRVVAHLGFAVFCLWLFGVLLLAVILLGSTLFKNGYGGLLVIVCFVGGLLLLNISSKIAPYNPLYLASGGLAYIKGTVSAADFQGPIIISILLLAAFVTGAVIVFNKKQV